MAVLQNQGQGCWNQCSTAGACPSYCGASGACCRHTTSPDTEPWAFGDGWECGGGGLGCSGMHCCVPSATPPTAPSPPAAPTATERVLLVDPGENRWPVEWFGDIAISPFHEVTPAPWHETSGVQRGFDFALPPEAVPAPSSLLTLRRSFLRLPDPPVDAASLPPLSFRANAVFAMWVSWRSLEPTRGVYSLDALEANYEATVANGWRFALRLLTSRVDEAPTYLSGLGIATLDGGLNFDPASPIFHERYVALLAALRSRRFCQRGGVAMLYAGYASTTWGDEYIGPHAADDVGIDPAVKYEHVRERASRRGSPSGPEASPPARLRHHGPVDHTLPLRPHPPLLTTSRASGARGHLLESPRSPRISSISSISSKVDRFAVDRGPSTEGLDAWAHTCENATGKVLMGGQSLYGTSLGFGTRNGFVEYYWCTRLRSNPPPALGPIT